MTTAHPPAHVPQHRRPQRSARHWLRPLADPSARPYRPPPRWYSRLQWIGVALTRLGLTPGGVVTLEVPGRRSGAAHRTTLLRTRHAGQDYLVSVTGDAEWVRNVRAAAGHVSLSRRGRSTPARLTEVPVPQRPPVLRAYVLRGGHHGAARVAADARAYFDVGPQVSETELADVADRFPVFLVTPDAGVATGTQTSARRRPLLGLRRRPGRLALVVLQMPLRAYRHDAGWLLGRTFLQFTHIGRRTGRPHDTVAMVLRYDEVIHEAVVVAGWGPDTDWVRNLRAGPAIRVQLGRESFVPEHRFLTDDEGFAVAAQFRREHPWRTRLASTILGWGDLTDDAALREFVRTHPFVAFRALGARDRA